MSSKSLSLGALALTAALNATPTLAQQSSVTMTQDQKHDRILELCKTPNFGKNIVNGTGEICDEYSTDGGKTWFKVGGGASVLALSLLALVQIRKRKIEKEKIADAELGDSEFLGVPFEENPEIDGDGETLPPDDEETKNESNTIDLVDEAGVYADYGRFEQATKLLLEELVKNPKNKNAHLKLAEVYKQMKEDTKIRQANNHEIKDADSVRGTLLLEESLSESELKKLIEAGNHEVQSTTEIPKTGENIDLVTEATLYMTNGRDDDAEAILLIAIKNDPEKIEAYSMLLKLYHKTKNISGFQNIFMHSEAIHGMNSLPEDDLIQAKVWGREIDPENPIYTELSTPTENVIPIEDAPAVQESIDLGPDTIVPEITEPTTEIAPPVKDIVIAHKEFNPSAVTISENILPVKVAEPENIPKKQQMMPGMDKPLFLQLQRRGFEVIKSPEQEKISIQVLREGSSLNILDKNEKVVQTIGYNEIFTIDNTIANTFLELPIGKKPRIRLEGRNGKTQHVEIIGHVEIKQ